MRVLAAAFALCALSLSAMADDALRSAPNFWEKLRHDPGCSLSDGTLGGKETQVWGLTSGECLRRNVQAMAEQKAEQERKLDESIAESIRNRPEYHPDVRFLEKFAEAPLEKRQATYVRMEMVTPRDWHDMPQVDRDTYMCLSIAEKVDVQRVYEASGSHGVYNMQALLAAGTGPDCKAFLQKMTTAPL